MGNLELAPCARVLHLHAGAVAARADAKERDAVAMARIHVGLDLEHEAAERWLGGSAMRSNLSVGLPIDLLGYEKHSLRLTHRVVIGLSSGLEG